MPAEATISLFQPDNCKSTSKYYKEESTQSSFTHYQGSLVKTFAKTTAGMKD